MHIKIEENLARTLDMFNCEIRLNDSVIAPEKGIIGEVWDILDDFETIKLRVQFRAEENANHKELVREIGNSFVLVRADEVITRNTRPFYFVK